MFINLIQVKQGCWQKNWLQLKADNRCKKNVNKIPILLSNSSLINKFIYRPPDVSIVFNSIKSNKIVSNRASNYIFIFSNHRQQARKFFGTK